MSSFSDKTYTIEENLKDKLSEGGHGGHHHEHASSPHQQQAQQYGTEGIGVGGGYSSGTAGGLGGGYGTGGQGGGFGAGAGDLGAGGLGSDLGYREAESGRTSGGMGATGIPGSGQNYSDTTYTGEGDQAHRGETQKESTGEKIKHKMQDAGTKIKETFTGHH